MELSNSVSTNYSTILEPGCRIFYGVHAAAPQLLRLCAEISARRDLLVLDFGNRCDMYFAARQLRQLTRDPAAAMKNIRLQRAFTCYQAVTLLRGLNRLAWGTPVIILDLVTPFLDENIKTTEISRLFGTVIELLHAHMKWLPLWIGVKPLPKIIAPERSCLMDGLAREFGMVVLRPSDEGDAPRLLPAQPSLFDFDEEPR